MLLSFHQRVAVVTGAAQGLGRAIAAALAAAGATVHLADVDAAGVKEAGQALALAAHAADLSHPAGARALVDGVLAAGGRIDVVVNAAGGVAGQVGRALEDVSEPDWRVLFAANADTTFWLAQAVAPTMKAAGYGRIVNIASGAGLRPSLTGIQGYTAAKHAVVGITRQLALELGPHGITVNAVAPGLVISNPATRLQWESYGPEGQRRLVESLHTRRLGRPEDIAAAVLFLASEPAGWITGQILPVDGGRA